MEVNNNLIKQRGKNNATGLNRDRQSVQGYLKTTG